MRDRPCEPGIRPGQSTRITSAPCLFPLLTQVYGDGVNHPRYIYLVRSFRPHLVFIVTHFSASECPAAARTVELLGSWDNFSKPYQLKRDTRRSSHLWSGCYIFNNIICDGDLTNLCEKRDGALLMGGTYWYYVSTFEKL